MKADAEYQRRRRAAETPEQREARLATQRERDGRRLARKTAMNPAAKPGRPRKESELSKSRTITLRPSQSATIMEIGDGRPSVGIVALIEVHNRR